MLKDDRVGVIEDGSGDRTVELLLDTSLSMVDEQATRAFVALGPELRGREASCGGSFEIAPGIPTASFFAVTLKEFCSLRVADPVPSPSGFIIS